MAETEIIPVGKSKISKPVLKEDLSQIKIKELPFKALGVWYKEEEVSELNIKDRLHSKNINLNMWRTCH